MKHISLLLIALFFTSCSGKEETNKLNLALISNKKISADQVCYQFYEQFGFTDLCEHYRTLYYLDQFKPTKHWKALPITKSDLRKINKSTSNKPDTLPASNLDVRYKYQTAFKDISLKMQEYINPDKDYVIAMKKGFYYFDKKHLKIYDAEKKLFYEEVHDCDGL